MTPDDIRARLDAEGSARLERTRIFATLTEAEQIAHGARHLTVAHGVLNTEEAKARVRRLTDTFWRLQANRPLRPDGIGPLVRSTSRTHTYLVPEPSDEADALIDALETIARRMNPGRWHIRRAAR